MSEPSLEQMRTEIFFAGDSDTPNRMSASEVRKLWHAQQAALKRAREAAKELHDQSQSPCVVGSPGITSLRMAIEVMVNSLNAGPKSRPRSIAITKLEEASMWLNEALRTE